MGWLQNLILTIVTLKALKCDGTADMCCSCNAACQLLEVMKEYSSIGIRVFDE